MIRTQRFRSAQRWEITRPASIVFPRPTSSASSAPSRAAREREERRIDLMRVQVDLRAGNRAGQALGTVGRTPPRQLVRKILRVIVGDHRASGSSYARCQTARLLPIWC